MYLDPNDPRKEHKRVVTHFRNIRLYMNAGMVMPECKAHAKLLDTDAGNWHTTGNKELVTCKHCRNKLHM